MSFDWDAFNKRMDDMHKNLVTLNEKIKARTEESRLEKLKRDKAEIERRENNVVEFKNKNASEVEYTPEERIYLEGIRTRTKNILRAVKKVKGEDATIIDFKTRQYLN